MKELITHNSIRIALVDKKIVDINIRNSRIRLRLDDNSMVEFESVQGTHFPFLEVREVEGTE